MMIRLIGLVTLLLLAATAAFASSAGTKQPKQMVWQFNGVFGTFDKVSIQRGLQVYTNVCAGCHGLTRVPFRKLTEVGFSEDEAKTLAAEYTYTDGPNDDGEMFDRPGKLSDKFPAAYANENAGRAANNGAYPPDLSLIIKARPDGANYVYSLLTGYTEPPHGVELGDGQYYNPYFSGGKLAMPQPLHADQVSYQDGTQATIDQMSRDVVSFLQWAAEPEMEARKHMGIRVMLFLGIFTVLFYIAMKRVWKDVK